MATVEQISTSRFLVKDENIEQYEGFLRVPGVKPITNHKQEPFALEIHYTHLPLLGDYGLSMPAYQVALPAIKGRVITSAPRPLRKYQQEAISFACEHNSALFMHDLGLGKTWMGLMSLIYPAIIVLPTSAIQVWLREAELFNLDAQVLQGTTNARSDCISMEKDLYLVTYGSMEAWLPYFRSSGSGPRVYSVCVDEAHSLHKKWSRWSASLKSIQSDFTLLMTATPMRNRLKSLHGLLDALAPGAFGSLSKFRVRYCGASIGEYGLVDGPELTHLNELALRMKDLVIGESWNSPRVRHLRPKLHREYLGVDVGLDERLGLLEDALSEIYEAYRSDYFGSHLEIMTKMRVEIGLVKAKWFLDDWHLAALAHKHARLIVWTWHKKTARMVYNWVKENLAVPVDYVTGEAPTNKRREMLIEWQDGDPTEPRILVATQGALATAVNLTTAEAAIWLEYSYAPIDIQQSEARHHRPGSRFEKVYAYYVVARNTIEEHIIDKLGEKITQAEQVLGSSSQKDQLIALLGG